MAPLFRASVAGGLCEDSSSGDLGVVAAVRTTTRARAALVSAVSNGVAMCRALSTQGCNTGRLRQSRSVG